MRKIVHKFAVNSWDIEDGLQNRNECYVKQNVDADFYLSHFVG